MKKKVKILLLLGGGVLLAICLAMVLHYFLVTVPDERETERRKQIVRDYYDGKVAQFEEENKTLGHVQVAFLGDSLTDGYDLQKYYPQYTTVNRGIGGDTTFGLEARLKVSAYDVNPDVVVMLIGGNNFDTMFENYESILTALQENLPDTKVVLLSLTAMSGDWAKNNEKAILNNQKIKSLAGKYGFTFVDLFTPLCDVDTGEMKEGYSTDGAHFTDLGFQAVTETVTPVLESLLGE